ncbi:MAG: DUF4416 family protein [PVC group bacterium]
MGEVKASKPVKMICGLLGAGQTRLDRGKEALKRWFGPIGLESDVIPFDFTDYYDKEMGPGILRRYVSLKEFIAPGDLAAVKLTTNRVEQELSEEGTRTVNLDPGYLDLSKMVLATTKDATYRVYLKDGIYAQSTYFFQNGTYHPWEWTYADYRTEAAVSFFNRVRKEYKRWLKVGSGEP